MLSPGNQFYWICWNKRHACICIYYVQPSCGKKFSRSLYKDVLIWEPVIWPVFAPTVIPWWNWDWTKGYAQTIIRAISNRLQIQGRNMTSIAAISTEGLVTVETTNNTVNGEAFLDRYQSCILLMGTPLCQLLNSSCLLVFWHSTYHRTALI